MDCDWQNRNQNSNENFLPEQRSKILQLLAHCIQPAWTIPLFSQEIMVPSACLQAITVTTMHNEICQKRRHIGNKLL